MRIAILLATANEFYKQKLLTGAILFKEEHADKAGRNETCISSQHYLACQAAFPSTDWSTYKIVAYDKDREH